MGFWTVGSLRIPEKCKGGAKGDAKVAKGDAKEVAKGDAKEVFHLPTFATSLHPPSHPLRIFWGNAK